MKTISSVTRAARNAKQMQYPYLDELNSKDRQRLMDLSGHPNRAGNIYTVVSDRNTLALRFDGNE